MLLAIGSTIATKHISHFGLGAIHRAWCSEVLRWGGLRLWGKWLRQQIEWAGGGTNFGSSDTQVTRRGRQTTMAKQKLDGAHIRALLQQVNRKSVRNVCGVIRFVASLGAR